MKVCFPWGFVLLSTCSLPAFIPTSLVAQERCATVEHTAVLYQKFNKTPQPEKFEQWIRQRAAQQFQTNKQQRTQTVPYQIPVVVHVVHNGEPVDIGRNIPDAQVHSQLDVLNDDFKRLNADASLTPTEFQSVASGMDIQFVLARQDPNGNPTTGIVRIQGRAEGYHPENSNDNTALKSLSFWDSNNYLNIWVCSLQDGYLGYAQFPISSLEGLEAYQDEIAATDGVVIDHQAFGSIDDGNFTLDPQFNKGRTLTHEVGHFFGLRHIWGDNSNCNTTTDYVEDTPAQNNETRGCPSHPRTSCNATKMFQNYMDYTDDGCMNLFTAGQVERMEVVIENSIRRVSLLSSPALACPPGGGQNISLVKILSPEPVSCASGNLLTLNLRNMGCEVLTSLRISYTIDGNTPVHIDQTISPTSPGETLQISIPLTLNDGEHLISVTVDLPNGMPDEYLLDNTLTKRFSINSTSEKMPTRERFESIFMDRWTIVNPDPNSIDTWETLPTFYSQSILFKNEDIFANESIWLVSPILDLTNLTESNLRFDWSYRNTLSSSDSFEFRYTTDCGLSYQSLTTFTLKNISGSFFPMELTDWESNSISLAPLIGNSQVRIAFLSPTKKDANLYLDNIELYAGQVSPKLPLEETVAIYAADPAGINLTFNVEEKQHVVVSVFDTMGKTVLHGVEPEILNQTYTYPLRNLQTGIYIVRIQADNDYYTQKVFIQGQ